MKCHLSSNGFCSESKGISLIDRNWKKKGDSTKIILKKHEKNL